MQYPAHFEYAVRKREFDGFSVHRFVLAADAFITLQFQHLEYTIVLLNTELLYNLAASNSNTYLIKLNGKINFLEIPQINYFNSGLCV